MTDTLVNPTVLLAACVSLAVLADDLPRSSRPLSRATTLKRRMKAVSHEREQIRARERARLHAETGRARLRGRQNGSVRQVVDKLTCANSWSTTTPSTRWKMAGYRSQNALNTSSSSPPLPAFPVSLVTLIYIFGLETMPDSELRRSCWR